MEADSQGHLWLHDEFKTSLGYKGPFHPRKGLKEEMTKIQGKPLPQLRKQIIVISDQQKENRKDV